MAEKMPLQGLKVLLTRPEGQNAEWRSAFEVLGAQVHAVPTLSIDRLPQPPDMTDLIEAADFGIFVSRNAVNALADYYEERSDSPMPWYAVGKRTAALARKRGFSVIDSDAYDSDSLLAHSQLQAVEGQHCVIVRGQGGRPRLAEELSTRGATVKYCELYQRKAAWQNGRDLASYLSRETPDLITASSVDNLNYSILLAQKHEMLANVKRATWLLPGERVLAAACEHGLKNQLPCISTRLDDVRDATITWWTTQQ